MGRHAVQVASVPVTLLPVTKRVSLTNYVAALPLLHYADTPQFRGGNPYFFNENPYQSVSFIYALMYRENVHAIHIAMQFAKKIATLCNKSRQPAANN